jgi:hypothetical protein
MSNYTDLLSNATQAEPLFGENMVKTMRVDLYLSSTIRLVLRT